VPVASTAIKSYSVFALRRTIPWQALKPFLFCGVSTLPAGPYLFISASQGRRVSNSPQSRRPRTRESGPWLIQIELASPKLVTPLHSGVTCVRSPSSKQSRASLRSLLSPAFGYIVVRMFEACGLWHDRAWGEWLVAVSGGPYIPLEISQLVYPPSIINAAVLAGNIFVVSFLVYRLSRRPKHDTTRR